MLAYYGSHILHTAVAYFDVVLVEKGVILVLLREVFKYELSHNKHRQNDRPSRNRKSNIIWYNPPFNSSVKTNIGKSASLSSYLNTSLLNKRSNEQTIRACIQMPT